MDTWGKRTLQNRADSRPVDSKLFGWHIMGHTRTKESIGIERDTREMETYGRKGCCEIDEVLGLVIKNGLVGIEWME